MGWDIVDGLLWVEMGWLATQKIQTFDDFSLGLAHASVKGSIEANRPATDDGDVVNLRHNRDSLFNHSFKAKEKGKSRVLAPDFLETEIDGPADEGD